jgi:hypothetical protein
MTSIMRPNMNEVYNNALTDAGLSANQNFTCGVTIINGYDITFSPGENPFASIDFKTPKVINSILSIFQDYDFNIVREAFRESDNFVEVVEYISHKFDVVWWSAAIDDYVVEVRYRVNVIVE